MKNKNLKSGVLTVVVLIGLVATNVLLNMQWFPIQETEAFAINADERNANNTPTVDDSTTQGATDVASDASGNYVVVWQSFNQDGSGNGIYFRRFDSKGNALMTNSTLDDILVNTTTAGNQNDPSIAMDQDGNFVIAWAGQGIGDTQGIFMRAFNANGLAATGEQIVNTITTDGQYLPTVALDYNGSATPLTTPNVVFTWYNYDAGFTDSDVYMRRFGVDFANELMAPMGTDELVNTYTTDNQNEPSVAMNNFGEILVAWHGPGTGYESEGRIWTQAYDNDGTAWGSNTLTSINAAGTRTDIAADKSSDTTLGGNFVISYDSTSTEDSNGGVFAKLIPRCSTGGCDVVTPVEILVNTSTPGAQTLSSVAADGMGNFSVSWVDQHADADGYDIFAQNFKYNKGRPHNAVARTGAEFRVNNAANQGSNASDEQTEPSVAMSTDGFYVITFKDYPTGNLNQADVHYQQFVSEMLRNGDETLNNPLDGGSPISQTSTDVAVSNTGLTASVWVDQTDGGVKFTLRDTRNNNAVVGTAGTRVDNPTTEPNATPSVSFYKDTNSASPGYGRFIIVWAGNGVGSDIYYREVDNAGNLLGAPTVLNTVTAGAQIAPHVEAGLYSFNTPTDAAFTAVWLDENDGVVSTYYFQGVFNENIIQNCAYTFACTTTAVDLNPITGDAVYAWDDDPSGDDLFVQRASQGGALTGSPIVIGNGSGGEQQYSPDVSFIKEGAEFLVAYVNEDVNGNFVKAKVYNFATTSNTGDFYVSTCTDSCDDTKPKVSSTNAGFTLGDSGTLFVWNNSGASDYEINGALWRYNRTTEAFGRFSPNFRINSTQDGDQFSPSVSVAGASNQMVVGWEGKWEDTPNTTATAVDNEASVSQVLYNPFYAEELPNLAPAAEQEIQQGGRTLSVPDTIVFPSVNVNPTTSTSAVVSIRDATNGGCTTDPVLDCTDPASKYIEISDLDGTPFTLTIIADSDFTNDADGENYILRNNFFVRNWDQNLAETGDDCDSNLEPELCFATINPLTPPVAPSFELDTSTTTAQPLDVSQTLATKIGNDIGVWRFYPDWLLNINALTPPGNHSTTVTITLQ